MKTLAILAGFTAIAAIGLTATANAQNYYFEVRPQITSPFLSPSELLAPQEFWRRQQETDAYTRSMALRQEQMRQEIEYRRLQLEQMRRQQAASTAPKTAR
jgi:hypothetical protein